MERAILNFPLQLAFDPEIENEKYLKPAQKYILGGMGGSHLAGGLLKVARPNLDIVIHRNYDLPELQDLKERLVIASSYSGNTEETLSFLEKARKANLNLIVISTGGKLLELALKYGLPFIQIPKEPRFAPRMAIGFSLRAILKAIGDQESLMLTKEVAQNLFPEAFREKGKELAQKLINRVPLIYSSEKNEPLAYNWKIRFNEVSKIPAFYNVFPELNHNEMEGFSYATLDSKNIFYHIFILDHNDHPNIQKRMEVLEKILKSRGFGVEKVVLEDKNVFYRIFANILLADWTALYLAYHYQVEPEQTLLIEEFKLLMLNED